MKRKVLTVVFVVLAAFGISSAVSAAYVGVGDILPNWEHVWWEGGDFLCHHGDCEPIP